MGSTGYFEKRNEDKKVLHIIPIPLFPLIGPCLRCLRQSQGLRKSGYEVSILSRKISKSQREEGALSEPLFTGITVMSRLPSVPTVLLREAVNILYSWWIILKTLNEIRPAIVHVHNPPETIAFITSIVCSFKNIPVVYDVHDGAYELISSLEIHPFFNRIYLATALFFEKVTLRKCAGILTVSDSLRIAMRKRAGKYIGDRPFAVMKNINPEVLNFADRYPGEGTDSSYLLYSGTLYTAMIGLEDIIDILPAINRKFGVTLVIAGDGPYRKKLEEYAKKKMVKDCIKILGHIERKRLYGIIHHAKLCVAPFRRTRQLEVALANKVFEYMALGKAIVYPDLPGFSEVLGNDNEGKYRPDDKSDLARTIEKMLSDDALRKSVGERNRHLLKNITFEGEFSHLLSLYDAVLNPQAWPAKH